MSDKLETDEKAQETATAPAEVDIAEPSTILHGAQLAAVFGAGLLCMFLVSLDGTILSTALPAIASSFNAYSSQGFVSSSFLLTESATILWWGQALKIHVAKSCMLAAIAIFELGSIICGAAPNIDALIAGRAIAGVGAAGISEWPPLPDLCIAADAFTVASLIVLMAQITSLDMRPKLLGWLGAVFGLSSIIGPLIGGAIVDHTTWRWCFFINLAPGLLAALAIIVILKAAPPLGSAGKDRSARALMQQSLHMDYIGSALFLGATALFVVSMQYGGNQKPWNSPTVLVCLVLAPLVYIAFGMWLRVKGEKALVPPSIFKSGSIYAILVFSFMTRLVLMLAMFFLPLFYQAVKQYSAVSSGLALLGLLLASVIASVTTGQIVSRFGRYWPFLIAGAALQTIGGGLLYTIKADTSTATLIGYQVLIGVGVGMTLQTSNLAMQVEFDDQKHLLAQSSGLAMAAQFLGGTVGLSISQAAFSSELRRNLAIEAPSVPVALVADNPLALYELPAAVVSGAVRSYVKSLNGVYIIIVPCAGISLIAACFIRNLDVRKKDETLVGAVGEVPSLSKHEGEGSGSSPQTKLATKE